MIFRKGHIRQQCWAEVAHKEFIVDSLTANAPKHATDDDIDCDEHVNLYEDTVHKTKRSVVDVKFVIDRSTESESFRAVLFRFTGRLGFITRLTVFVVDVELADNF